jgi:hypothetical protein
VGRRVERWLEEAFTNRDQFWSEFQSLKPREQVIVAASLLDVALVDLIQRRLRADHQEIDRLLGIDEFADAPVDGLGARITLAYLLGLLTPGVAHNLRCIAKIRNHVAHRVSGRLLDAPAQKALEPIRQQWMEILKTVESAAAKQGRELLEKSRTQEDAAAFLIMLTTHVNNDRFMALAPEIERLEALVEEESEEDGGA